MVAAVTVIVVVVVMVVVMVVVVMVVVGVVVVVVDYCRYNDHSKICVLTVLLNRETPIPFLY